MGSQGVGKKRKACHGDSEEEKKCVCVREVQWDGGGGLGERDYHWRHLKNLEV